MSEFSIETLSSEVDLLSIQDTHENSQSLSHSVNNLSEENRENEEKEEKQIVQTQETFWNRVRYPNEDTQDYPWTLQYIEGQGYAAFASRDIQPGEIICIEMPVIWITGHHPFSSKQMEEIVKKVQDLKPEDQRGYYDMANVFSAEEYPVEVGIFMTNCFDMTDSIYGECSGMYLALARLNHSCSPNVQQTHIPETTEEYVISVKLIQKGEELNDCYIDLRQKKEKRQQELAKYYRFQCTCKACGLEETEPKTFRAEELYREKCSQLTDDTIELINQKKHKEALKLNKEICKELEENHLEWALRYLAEIYLNMYYIYLHLKDSKNAKKSLKKCLKLNEFTQGKKSPDVQKVKKMLKDLDN